MGRDFCCVNIIPDVYHPAIVPRNYSEQVKKFANKSLAGKLNYKEAHLTFFRHFPSLRPENAYFKWVELFGSV